VNDDTTAACHTDVVHVVYLYPAVSWKPPFHCGSIDHLSLSISMLSSLYCSDDDDDDDDDDDYNNSSIAVASLR